MRPGIPETPPDLLVSHEQLRGDSQLLFQRLNETFEPQRTLTVPSDRIGDLDVIASPNSEGRLAKLRVDNIPAASYKDARIIGLAAIQKVLSQLSLMYDVPIDVFRIDVIEEKTSNQHILLRFPYSIGVWNTAWSPIADLNKCAALYWEALGSASDLYAFLCLYKIVEAVDGLQVQNTADALARGEPAPRRMRLIIPKTDDEIRPLAESVFPGYYNWNEFELLMIAPPEARGHKLFTVRDKYITPIRHLIAHGLLDDEGLIDVDDPQLLERVRYWLQFMRFAARFALLSHFFPELFESQHKGGLNV